MELHEKLLHYFMKYYTIFLVLFYVETIWTLIYNHHDGEAFAYKYNILL